MTALLSSDTKVVRQLAYNLLHLLLTNPKNIHLSQRIQKGDRLKSSLNSAPFSEGPDGLVQNKNFHIFRFQRGLARKMIEYHNLFHEGNSGDRFVSQKSVNFMKIQDAEEEKDTLHVLQRSCVKM